MVVDQGPLSSRLIAQVEEFLRALKERRFDIIWDTMMTYRAQELLSSVVVPLKHFDQDQVDSLLDLETVRGMALAFQMNYENIRTGLFDGLANSFDPKWFELDHDDYMTFAIDGAAVVINGSHEKALFIPFVEKPSGEFVVDWEAFVVFSMTISSQKLFGVGTRALVYNHPQTAELFFSYSARLADVYDRLKQLVLDQIVVQRYITPQRKGELEAEITHARRAQAEVEAIKHGQTRPTARIDMTTFLHENFKGYALIADIVPSEHDLEKLSLMSDSDLRKSVAKLLKRADRGEVQREARKSHGPAELADMVVDVRFNNHIYSLCLPFKTGREVGFKKAVPESVVYQIWRPHMFLSSAVVVFVTARPCSQFLRQDIRQSQDRMGWPIGIIEYEALASLLKANKLL